MSSSTVRVYTAPVCEHCGKQSIHIVDNPHMEVLERMELPLETPGEVKPLPDEFVIENNDVRLPDWWDFTFRIVEGESGRGWLIPDPEIRSMGSYIFCTAHEDWSKKGEGFGGSTLTFKLSNGNTFDLKGGWHANAVHMFEDTGVDLRNKHVTFVVLAKGIEYNQLRLSKDGRSIHAAVLNRIVYMDPPGGIEGYFMRGKHIAVEYVKTHNEAIFEYSNSNGGSSYGRVGLDDVIRDPEDMW